MLRPSGRTGAGATTHCVHGKNVSMRETVLDWKPFEYHTVEQDNGSMGKTRTTFRLEPEAQDSTGVHSALTGDSGNLPQFVGRPIVMVIYTPMFHMLAQKMRKAMESRTAPTEQAV